MHGLWTFLLTHGEIGWLEDGGKPRAGNCISARYEVSKVLLEIVFTGVVNLREG